MQTKDRRSPALNVSIFRLVAGLVISCMLFSSCGKGSSPKFRQYYVQGEKLYLKHCSNCHQANGTGLGRVYPPLHTSDYMDQNFEAVVCLMRFGKSGEMIVNGRQYQQAMPGNLALSDLEIAEITTYIYNSWSHERGLTEVRDVAKILQGCTAPTQ